ncbi:sensor histidine kinase [Solitalea longa]|nr:7TM-DISM domain-containing protein [Solitalea longa]
MASRLLTICLLLGFSIRTFAQFPLDTLDIAIKRSAHLTHYYKYLEDCKGYSQNEVAAFLNSGQFKSPIPKQAFNMGISACSYWLAIALKNSSADEKSIAYTFYNNGLLFNLYELKNNSAKLIDSNSMHKPLLERNFPVRGVSFQLLLKPHETKILLIRIKGTTASSIYTPIDISSTNELLFFEIGYSYLIGKYIGYFLLALIANLLLWAVLKNKLHFFLACYILIILGFILDDFHFDSMEFGGRFFRHWSYVHEVFFVGMALYFCSRVFILFTDQQNENPRLYYWLSRYNLILLLLSVIVLLSSLTFNYSPKVYKIAGTITYYYTAFGFFLLIYVLLYGVVKKQYYALLYFISSALLLAGFVSYIAGSFKLGRLLNIRPGNIINGLALEITILTFFFVYKYKKEKDELQEKTLESIKLKEEHSAALLEMQENERTRIANDLHDDVGNTLNGLRLMTQNYFAKTPAANNEEAEYRQQLLDGIKKVNIDLRNISHNLLPENLALTGLISSIKNRLNLYNVNNTGIYITFIHEGNIEALPDKVKLIVYRIINELLQNTVKHSEATKATMQCLLFDNSLQIIMEDNGRGFNNNANQQKGLGINSIQSRVDYLNGIFEIDSNENGTTIIIEIPAK